MTDEATDDPLVFEVEPRTPDPDALLAVHDIRHGVAELAAAREAVYRAHDREQRIRVICELNWDLAAARKIVAILDERD